MHDSSCTFFVLLRFHKISIIMSSFKDLIYSAAYKAFMKKLLIYAFIVFGLGIVFMLCKLPGGNIMTITGGSVLIVWMVFFIIGKLVENNS